METMNERLRSIRLSLSLSQDDFGNSIGIKSRAHISALESGARNITDRIFNDICEKHNVNEEWFRTGTGEMFRQNENTALSALAEEYHLDDLDRRIIKSFLDMNDTQRRIIKDYIKSVSSTIAATTDIDAELESYRLELEVEKGIPMSQVSQGTGEKAG